MGVVEELRRGRTIDPGLSALALIKARLTSQITVLSKARSPTILVLSSSFVPPQAAWAKESSRTR
jgi:hypothetical protein